MPLTKAGDVPVRTAVAAGGFYPDEPDTLRKAVNGMLADVGVAAEPAVGVLVPHAGYAFSGSCAAAVFARVDVPPTAVLVGPDHFAAGNGASVWRSGAFATPLGDVAIDEEFVAELLQESDLVTQDPDAHGEEHALEVELPFLLVRAAPRQPKIVPILLRWHDWPRCQRLAAAIAAVAHRRGRENVLLLASSDMTHFEPAAEAQRRDKAALAATGRLDGEGLLKVCHEQKITMCGRGPAAVVLEAACRLGASRADVVAHTHSGMATGDFSRVVSYAGVIIR